MKKIPFKIIFLAFSSILITQCQGCKEDDFTRHTSIYIPNMYTINPIKDTISLGDTLNLTIHIPKKLDDLFSIKETNILYVYFGLGNNKDDNYYGFVPNDDRYYFKNGYFYFDYIDINGKVDKSRPFFVNKDDTYSCELKFTINLDSLSFKSFKEDFISLSPYLIIPNNSIEPDRNVNISLFATFKHNKSNEVSFLLKKDSI